MVKTLWDEDVFNNTNLQVVLLGSAPILLQHGLFESLAGRFEMIYVSYWNYSEMKDALNFNLNQFIYFGGYPGAADFINDEERWRQYLHD